MQGADDDVERAAEAESARAGFEVADAAGVEAARFGFECADDFHAFALGRAGNAAAGEGGAEDVGGGRACLCLCFDAAGHLPYAAEGADFERFGDAHAAGLGDFAQVVTQ